MTEDDDSFIAVVEEMEFCGWEEQSIIEAFDYYVNNKEEALAFINRKEN